MPCVPVQIGNARGFVCVRGMKPKRCVYCERPAEFLCDWPKGKKTCDRPMCTEHAQEVDANLHQCRAHAAPGLF